MRAMTDRSLDDQLQELVDQPLSDAGPARVPDPVNQPMIRHWAAAFEDENPVYTDADAAAASRFGTIVAPPLMLQTWTMATPRSPASPSEAARRSMPGATR